MLTIAHAPSARNSGHHMCSRWRWYARLRHHSGYLLVAHARAAPESGTAARRPAGLVRHGESRVSGVVVVGDHRALKLLLVADCVARREHRVARSPVPRMCPLVLPGIPGNVTVGDSEACYGDASRQDVTIPFRLAALTQISR